MEKKSNLPNADELSVEYVLNELDPSEAVLVERAMEKDMNLLIEIECLRRTLKKLDDLPNHNPPAELRDAIVHQAVNHYYENRRSLFLRWNNTTAMATAAAVVFSVLISVVNFYPDQPAGSVENNVIEAANEIKPWIDNNNVLHINQANAQEMLPSIGTSDLQHSLQRLRPIQNNALNTEMREIHLTRTSN